MSLDCSISVDLPVSVGSDVYSKCFRRTNIYNIARPTEEYIDLVAKKMLKIDLEKWEKNPKGEKPSLQKEKQFYSNFVVYINSTENEHLNGVRFSEEASCGCTIDFLDGRIVSELLPNIEVSEIIYDESILEDYKYVFKGGKLISSFVKMSEYEIGPCDSEEEFEETLKKMTEWIDISKRDTLYDKHEEKEKNDPEYEERSKKVEEWIHKLYKEEEEKGK